MKHFINEIWRTRQKNFIRANVNRSSKLNLLALFFLPSEIVFFVVSGEKSAVVPLDDKPRSSQFPYEQNTWLAMGLYENVTR